MKKAFLSLLVLILVTVFLAFLVTWTSQVIAVCLSLFVIGACYMFVGCILADKFDIKIWPFD